MVVIYVYLEGENEITLKFHMNNSSYCEKAPSCKRHCTVKVWNYKESLGTLIREKAKLY